MHVYYFQRGVLSRGQDRVRAFPQGLRMRAGAPNARSAAAEVPSSAVTWSNIDYKGCDKSFDGFPDSTTCGIWQPRIMYPNCWCAEGGRDDGRRGERLKGLWSKSGGAAEGAQE